MRAMTSTKNHMEGMTIRKLLALHVRMKAPICVKPHNLAGQIVYSEDFEYSTTIDKALTPGIYTAVIKYDGGVFADKLVVK